MSESPHPSRNVILRDLIIFHVKLWMDGLKDVVLAPLSFVAALIDMLFATGDKRLFYQVLRLGERFDLWLNLYGATQGAEHDPDGLFGVSEAGDSTFVGQLERLVQAPFVPVHPSLSNTGGSASIMPEGGEAFDIEWSDDAEWSDLDAEDGEPHGHGSPSLDPASRRRSPSGI